MRQKVTDICYMMGVPEELIPQLVSTKTSTAQLLSHMQAEEKRKRKEIDDMNKELKKMHQDLDVQGDTIYKVDLMAPEHVECSEAVRKYNAMRELSNAGKNVIKSEYDQQISDLKTDLARMHAIEGELELDNVELELREARMTKIVPAVNSFACWLTKDNAILFNERERSLGNPDYVKGAGFERRHEDKSIDPFWESMDAPWDHSIGEGWFSPSVEEVRALKQQQLEEEEEEERRNTTTTVHTGLVEEEEEEAPIVFAEKPFMICFGDPRALRPVYMPSAGTQAAALSNAFHHIGVDLENVVDGNDLFFGNMKAIGERDHTKMELLRSLLLEQLLVHPNYPEEGGNLEAEIGHIKRPQKKGEMTMIMTAFDKHEKLERECIERYKLPTQNTYLYERQCEDRGHADTFPPYIENFEVWFGNILPPMENERRRFGFYDVRKRTKKADKQMLLWTGVVFTREEDVQKVKELIIDEVGRIKPLFEDVEDTGAKTFALSNIVGKAKQRRWADAFVRADVEREGSLPADKVFEIIQGPKYKHQLEIKVPIATLEAQWDEMYPELDRVVDSMTYAEYEDFVMEVSTNFEKETEENAFFRAKRKEKLRTEYETELINMFNRYDWDKSGSLEYKEVFGILAELKFSDIDAEMVEALVDQYDKDGNGAVDEDEFLELALEALLTLTGDGSLIGSIANWVFDSGPRVNMGVVREEKKRVALWFDEADSAENDLGDVDLTPLGELQIINGFEVMCRAADMNVNKADRKVFYDDKFRMEMVRMLFMKAFVYVDKSSNKQAIGENATIELEKQLSSIGSPDGCLSKEAFLETIDAYKMQERKLQEFKKPPIGPRHLLERMSGDEDLWKNVGMHLKFCDIIEIQSNDDVIAPSPKAGSRFDLYTCRPDDIKTDNGINWILIVFNEAADIDFLSSNYSLFEMEK
mmetsp:Transcript_32336/g.84932  ORF Transcript_32336/g.84932 Transcript_32336/m.84932 type:complete len:928 (+) Transcript_32336:260-3043(+)